MAIGWVFTSTHFGQIIRGSLETSDRSISKEALPEPTIMAALSSVTGTRPARRTSPTSWRLSRWGESFSAFRPSPPR